MRSTRTLAALIAVSELPLPYHSFRRALDVRYLLLLAFGHAVRSILHLPDAPRGIASVGYWMGTRS